MRKLFRFFTRSPRQTLLLACTWTLLILIACLIPGKEMPDVDIPLVDKWVHFLIFGGFSFLWLCMVQKSDIKSYSLIFLISVLFGYGVELLQDSGITRGRSFDAYDVIADGIGGVIGILLFHFLQKAYGLRK